MIAALGTIELRIMEYTINEKFEADRTWSAERRPVVRGDLDARLLDLQARLGDGLWLEADGFTIGDLIMVSVLGGLRGTGVLEQFPGLAA